MTKTNIILTFLLILALVAMRWLHLAWIDEKKERTTLQDQYDEAIKNNDAAPLVILDTIRDTVAGTVTYIYPPVVTKKNTDGYVSKGLADTLAKALKVATKEIDHLTSKIISIEGKGKGERIKDTITKTEWLVMKPDPVFDVKVNLLTDSIYPSAKIRLAQAYAPYRKNVFSRYQYRSAIMAYDPRIQISEVYDVNKVPRSPRWGLGVTVGPVITPKGFTWGASVGFSYDLIQF
ncbi:hypothetical protein GCM10022216_14620 [Sphingobacterium kyonggiense]|uniref:DUF6808 domain-containing protein n=2 Tax=Sphingobacterium kyonggiense TaxID=714075 RepID=A0ABP7YNJ0_9SPHI